MSGFVGDAFSSILYGTVSSKFMNIEGRPSELFFSRNAARETFAITTREIQRVLFRGNGLASNGAPCLIAASGRRRGRRKRGKEGKNRLYRAVERVIFPRVLAIRSPRSRE